MFLKFPQACLMSIAAFVSVVGGVSANQFVVYLPTVEPSSVSQVRTIAPDAFYSQLDSGQRVLQVGRYNSLAIAQKRVQEFRQAGFNAEMRSVAPRTATLPTPIPVENFPPATLPPPPLPGVPPVVNSPAPAPIEVSRPAPISQPISNLPPAPPVSPVAISPSMEALPLEENRYFVIIPTNSAVILQKVKTIAPQAKLKSSNRGPYIEVQGYADRASAETMTATIRGQGFDARVAFF